MKQRFFSSIGTGIGALIMVLVPALLKNENIVTWGAFLGCSSFFLMLNDSDEKTALRDTIISNFIGTLIGLGCIAFGGSTPYSNAIVTGLFSFLIIMLTIIKSLRNGSVTFIGGATIFAMSGAWIPAVLSLFFGNIMGLFSLWLGNKLYNANNKT